jgi:hypothetical protein
MSTLLLIRNNDDGQLLKFDRSDVIDAVLTHDSDILLISTNRVSTYKITGEAINPQDVVYGSVKLTSTWSDTLVLLKDGTLYAYSDKKLKQVPQKTSIYKYACSTYGSSYAVDIDDKVFKVSSDLQQSVPGVHDAMQKYHTKNIIKIQGKPFFDY